MRRRAERNARDGWRHRIGLWRGMLGSGCGGWLALGTPYGKVDVAGNWQLASNRPKGEQILRWFSPTAFVPPAEGAFGNSGRNNMRGPGSANVDWGLFKQIPIVEQHALQFRAEFFNLFNRTNLGLPNNNLQSAQFGRITSAGSPRVIQFALKNAC